MPLFKSQREKQLWLWTLLIVFAIFSPLLFGQPLERIFRNEWVQAAIFMAAMALMGVGIFFHGWIIKKNKKEIVIWIGILAVYLMFFLRLGLTERSHLIEYSILAIFFHKALLERSSSSAPTFIPAALAFLFTFIIGIFDECIQIFIPTRVFDWVDIFFNGMAAFMAIMASLVLYWIKRRIKNTREKKQDNY